MTVLPVCRRACVANDCAATGGTPRLAAFCINVKDPGSVISTAISYCCDKGTAGDTPSDPKRCYYHDVDATTRKFVCCGSGELGGKGGCTARRRAGYAEAGAVMRARGA